MHISVAYAEADSQVWTRLDVPDDCTVAEAIRRSGILERFPAIDLERQQVGIFGKLAKPDASVREGDRVEIYRPIVAAVEKEA